MDVEPTEDDTFLGHFDFKQQFENFPEAYIEILPRLH